MRLKNCIQGLLLATLLFQSCQKLAMVPGLENQAGQKNGLSGVQSLSSNYCYSCGIIDNMPSVDYSADSIERPTQLGLHHVNPYLIPNIQQAYNNLGLGSITAAVTDQYVRFSPSSGQQLATLDSLLDIQNIELFDTPVDYDVVQEGDYYQDPFLNDSRVTYQYAVVPVNFQFPAAISYTILAQIHIPNDDYTAVETEAERLAAIQDSLNNSGTNGFAMQPALVGHCLPNAHWDPVLKTCVPNGDPGPDPGPPPPAPDAAIPAGIIKVHDYNIGSDPGIRTLRVIAKRWFKVERLYTDNTGHFVGNKRFKHKVKIKVKFKNDYATIIGVRGIRLWQMYTPIGYTLGVYNSNKNNISANFGQNPVGNSNTGSKGNRYWVAATVTNAVQEHRDYAGQYGFSSPPMGLNIMLTNWAFQEGLASTPLFRKRGTSYGKTNEFISVFLGNASALTPLNLPNMDIVLDYYLSPNSSQHFSSEYIKNTAYHELSHASHYAQVGNVWYTNFVNNVLAESAANLFNSTYSPYGSGSSGLSPIIAVGEAWGYHMSSFLANQKYNVENSFKGDFNVTVQKNGYVGYDLDALENFNPILPGDPFAWIPKGLMLDLIDNSPAETIVADQVSGYTNQQLFGALQSGVTSVSQYKDKLILLYGTAQQAQVNNLFASYHY